MTREVQCVMAILNGTQPKGMQCNFHGNSCGLCGAHVVEDAVHVLWDCEGLTSHRGPWWRKLLRELTTAMARDLEVMPCHSLIDLLLSGPGSGYIPEWAYIYTSFAKFVWSMYRMRHSLYNDVT